MKKTKEKLLKLLEAIEQKSYLDISDRLELQNRFFMYAGIFSNNEKYLRLAENGGAIKIISIQVNDEKYSPGYFDFETIFIIEVFHMELQKFKESLAAELEQVPKNADWFSVNLGRGSIKGREFRLLKGKPSYILFCYLLKNNFVLDRNQVIEILKLTGSEGSMTIEINERVKQLRSTLRLSTSNLTNNGGDLALLLNLKNKPPKTS